MLGVSSSYRGDLHKRIKTYWFGGKNGHKEKATVGASL